MEIRDARSLPAVSQEDLRCKAIKAIRDGKKQVEVAKILGITRQAVGKWVKAHREGGAKALRAKPKGRPKGGALFPRQAAQITKAIVDHYPEQLKLPSYLWTREAVAQLIKRKFGIKVSIWTVGRYLARWGFTPQKPVRQAFEKSPEQVRHWFEEKYPAIRRQAKREGAEIYWGDEMGMRSDPQSSTTRRAHLVFIDECGFMLAPLLRRTWAPRGQTPVIKIAEPHARISTIGALTISPIRSRFGFYFHLLPDNANFRGNSIVAFVESVRRCIGRPLIVLWDQIPIHRSYPVERYLSKHEDVVAELFPPYAPELNPVDRVWAYVKYGRLANYCPHSLDQLRKQVTSELSRVRTRPDLLRSFFRATGLEL